ncbi:hypothetical protein LTR36_002429 [Oleoguttula mirabilis]|uniref:Uncharacterized protein n=1 Tax=Oleoguttula mirabilis TaxID=1507867 RepID=A0AAV9JMX7_9PEZI|nr:hypothetical protein LTR36_002429 [Oleoguttula mirabilis]
MISDVLKRMPLSDDLLKRMPLSDDLEIDEVSHNEVSYDELQRTGSNNFCLWKSPENIWIITAMQDITRPAESVTNLTVLGGHDMEA